MNSAVAVVGLGKLGGPLAALLAARGHQVLGIDQDPSAIEKLRPDKLHSEPRLGATLDAGRQRLVLTTKYTDAIPHTSLACVVVPTPSDEAQPRFSLKHVLAAVQQIVEIVAAARLPEYTINLISTVMPGDCQQSIWPQIERASAKWPSRIHLVYSPEFIALGDVIRGLEEPDFLLVGGPSSDANARVARLHGSLTVAHVPVVETNWVNAELAKLAINCLLGVKVSWANMLAAACEQLPHADVDEVTRAIGHDSRIGAKYLTGGLGFGGPCLPRDLQVTGNGRRQADGFCRL